MVEKLVVERVIKRTLKAFKKKKQQILLNFSLYTSYFRSWWKSNASYKVKQNKNKIFF